MDTGILAACRCRNGFPNAPPGRNNRAASQQWKSSVSEVQGTPACAPGEAWIGLQAQGGDGV